MAPAPGTDVTIDPVTGQSSTFDLPSVSSNNFGSSFASSAATGPVTPVQTITVVVVPTQPPTIAPPPHPAEKVIITNNAGQVMDRLRVAKWWGQFEDYLPGPYQNSTLRVKGVAADGTDFIDRMDDKFYVRAYDPTKWNSNVGSVTATLQTVNDGGYIDYNDPPTTEVLFRDTTPGWQGWYVSDSQILVSSKIDDNYAEDRTQVGPDESAPNYAKLGNVKFGHRWPMSDRTHLVALGGKVYAQYNSGDPGVGQNGVLTTSAGVPPRGVVRVHITDLNVFDPKTNKWVPSHQPSDVVRDLSRARETLAQIGIRIDSDPLVTSNPPTGVDLSDGFTDGWQLNSPRRLILSPEERDLFKAANLRSQNQGVINIYYVNRLVTSNSLGYAIPKQYAWAWAPPLQAPNVDNVVIGKLDGHQAGTAPRALPVLGHEITHILEIRPLWSLNSPDLTHFPYDLPPAVSLAV